MSYDCPICGYNKMTRPAVDFYICPCCGTEFENDDFETSHAELQQQWLNRGALWFSKSTPKPENWSPYLQVANVRESIQTSRAGTKNSSIKVVSFGKSQYLQQNGVKVSGEWRLIETSQSPAFISV